MRTNELFGEADALSSKHEGVSWSVPRAEVALFSERAEEMDISRRRLLVKRMEELREIHVLPDVDQVPIVDARAAHALLVDAEAERPHQVERRGRGRTEPRDVASVGRYFGLYEHDVKRDAEGLRAEARGLGGRSGHSQACYDNRMGALPKEVLAYRENYRAREIGPHYRGWLHFAFTSVGSLTVIAVGIANVKGPTALDLLTVPATFLFANFAEYFGHKGPMHHAYGRLLFQRHTREHHHFFTHEAMAYESSRDFKMVLFPPVMLFFFLGVIAAPIAGVLFAVATHNVAWLFVTTAMSYFLTYEWLHFAYHLGEDSALGRLPIFSAIFRVLRRHHETHHDKAKMSRFNFNITFPIADVIFRTIKVSQGSEGSGGHKSNGDAIPEEAASPGNHRSA